MGNLYDLTSSQNSIWVTEKYFPNTNIGNICGNLFIEQKVDFSLLEKALNIYVQKNDSIRLHIVLDENTPKQYVNNYKYFSIPIVDVKNENELAKINENTVNTPFKLINSDLFSFILFRFPNGNGGFIMNLHHLIADAWSMSLLLNEVTTIYAKLLKNENINLSLNNSYIKYITKEKEYLESAKYKKDEEFWNNTYNVEPETANMKIYKNEETIITAKRKIFDLNKNTYLDILNFCKKNGFSIFAFLMSVYSIYLAKINNMESITVGSPILNRTNFEEKHTSGMFISTVPFKINLQSNIDFITFTKSVSKNQLSILRHQKYPYQELLKNIKNNFNNINNIYDVAISYQNARDNSTESEVKYHSKWIFNGNISDSMEIHFFDMDNTGNLKFYYDYQINKFEEKEIDIIHERILNIINQVLNNKNILINNIEVITKNEKEKILAFNNSAKADYPKDKNIIQLFNEQVKLNPNKIAIKLDEKSLTYKELDIKSSKLANYLINNKVNKQDVIAIFMNKSLDYIISILAILKTGSIYLPLDINYPEERISYILKDSKAKCIITEQKYLNTLNSNIKTITIDEEIESYSDDFNAINISSDSIAYIMYTSGSTGTPKGVTIPQKGIIRLVKNTNYIKFNKNDRILQTGSIVFDASTFEIWGALLNGLELYLLKKSDLLNPIFFERYILENNISTIFLTTALFNKFCEYNSKMFKNLKYLLTGGEAVSKRHMHLARKNNPNLNLIHVYGPTENTTFSTYYYVKDNKELIPIGYPISNTSCYVVSKLGGLQPLGVPGELLVGGDGLSTGYLNRTDLNNDKFIDNPFEKGKIYKTGDLVEQLPDGAINFIGRIDNQVKIRGFRIELSEIDSIILNYPEIKESITVLINKDTEKHICTYFSANRKININKLKEFIKEQLPSYMVPSYTVQLHKLPLNINGKVERKKLPPVDFSNSNKKILKPKNEIEEEILKCLQEITKKENISTDDNFIDDIGMDSLNSMELATKLYKYDITIQDITTYPAIKLLAKKISKKIETTTYNNKFIDVNIKNNSTKFNLSNILLTGATGFLGSHILYELLNNNKIKNIYCLVRKKNNVEPENRIKKILYNYFGEIDENIYKKIIIVNGDLKIDKFNLSDIEYNNLLKNITTVIHCGAKVKHFGRFDGFYKTNVAATEKIIEFCKEANSSLGYISTISVGGLIEKNKQLILDENKININQEFKDQVYMYSKYLAECKIIKETENNTINAKIFRLGNIMPRFKDGKFQSNFKDNAFLCKIHTIIETGEITKEINNLKFDISPVDLCATSIIKILDSTNNNLIYHIFNNNKINFKQFFDLANINLNIVDKKDFINSILKIDDLYSVHLLNELKLDNYIETPINNTCTINFLNNLDFYWNKIDKNYINYLINIQNNI